MPAPSDRMAAHLQRQAKVEQEDAAEELQSYVDSKGTLCARSSFSCYSCCRPGDAPLWTKLLCLLQGKPLPAPVLVLRAEPVVPSFELMARRASGPSRESSATSPFSARSASSAQPSDVAVAEPAMVSPRDADPGCKPLAAREDTPYPGLPEARPLTAPSRGVPPLHLGAAGAAEPEGPLDWRLLPGVSVVLCVLLLCCVLFVRLLPARSEDLIGTAARLPSLPPHFLVCLSACSTPTLTALIFGPPCPKDQAGPSLGAAKEAAAAVFLLLFLAAVLQDLRVCAAVWYTEELGTWPFMCAVAAVLGSSSNVLKFASNMALIEVYAKSQSWQRQHGVATETISSTMRQSSGVIFECYVFASIVYFAALILMALFAIPALLAYLYISGPLIGLCFAGARILAPLLVQLRQVLQRLRQGSYTAVPLPSSIPNSRLRETMTSLLQPGCFGAPPSTDAEVEAQYRQQAAAYASSGAPLLAWEDYFIFPLFCGVVIPLFAPVAARLYAGAGYAAALSRTLTERSAEGYFGDMFRSLGQALDFVWRVL